MNMDISNKYWKIIIKVLADKNVDVSTINEDTMFTQIGLDSLDMLNIVVKIEKEYKIKFEDEDIMNLKTVKDAIKLLEKNL